VVLASALAAGFAGGGPIGVSVPGASATQPSAGSVLDGVFTAAQASRGERTFREVCAACHDTVEFSGGRFRITWVGLTAGDLFDTIATLMPEGDPGSLSPAQYASVVAYLLDLNGYPAGETALPTNLSALQALEIVEAP
jgi:mono/diheme cytochrome c family protein